MFHLSKTHRLGLMIIMALAYFAVELVVGHLCDSVTLVADSFHMLSDVLALIVALGAVRVGKKPRDGRHTYGFQRAEILGTLVNTVMLVTLCFTIIIEAVQKIIEPHPMKDPKLIVYVGSGGLLINLIGILLFCGHSHGHGGHASEHSHQAELLMQHKSVEFLPEEARPMAQAAAAEAGDEPMKVECMDEQDNASPKRATAGATAAAAAASGAVATSSAAVPILIEQTSPAASTSAAHPVAPASDRASSPSLLAAVEHSVASLRRGSLGPSWLPNALPRPSEIDEVDQGEGDDVALDAGSGGGGGGGHGHSHEVGASRGSGHMNMQAAFLHIIGDTLGSVIVIVSAVTLWLAPPGYSLDLYEARAVLLGNDTCLIEEPGRRWQTYIDPSLSLLLVAIMLFSTIPLFLKALNILMQTVPKEIKLDDLQKRLENLDGILQVHDLHVWQLQSDCYIGTVHIRCRDLPEYISHTTPRLGGNHTSGRFANNPGCFINCGNNKCAARSNCCAVKGGGGGDAAEAASGEGGHQAADSV
uniref:Zinc transporter 1 n=1 Tax=Macrostomum lignano TaxID=282301 RepID=A0A1I8HIW3_9PLAT